MTIESQVAALVTATNCLIEKVTHRLDEVDSALLPLQGLSDALEQKINDVDAALLPLQGASDALEQKVDGIDATLTTVRNSVAALPTTLLGPYVIIVDQISGSNASPDQDGAVVQTIDEAFRRAKPFKNTVIKLASNQTHTFNTDVNVVADDLTKGLETGYITICDRDRVSQNSALPTAQSPVLNWSAVLISALNVFIGGRGQSLTLNHITGTMHAQRPQGMLGSGRAPTDIAIANCRVLLNCANPSYPLCNTTGRIELNDCLVEQNVASDQISGDGAISFSQSGSTLSGTAKPRTWDDLIPNRTNLSIADLKAQVSQGVGVLYVDQLTGSDSNDGLSLSSALYTVDEAIERAIPGQSWEIRLGNGQTFTIARNHTDAAHHVGVAGYIWFRDSAGDALNTGAPGDTSPHLIVNATLRLARHVSFGGYNCPLKVTFQGPTGQFRPLLDDTTADQGNTLGSVRASFSHCLITLDSMGASAVWGAFQVDSFALTLRSCTVNQRDLIARLVGRNGYGTVGTFQCSGSTLAGVATIWGDLFQVDIAPKGPGTPLSVTAYIEVL